MESPASHLQRGLPRGGLWLVLAAAHVALLYLANQWSPRATPFVAPPLEASLLAPSDETFAPPEPPPPQLASLRPPTLDVPALQIAAQEPRNAITLAPGPPAPAPPATADELPPLISDVAYIEAPAPHYPPESRRSREEGLVVLRVLIDEHGRATRIEVHRSSGHRRLDDAARAAVERAVFRPYVEDGSARPARVMIPIEFALSTRSAQRQQRG